MKTIELMIFGRSRFKFQKLFPLSKFEGYEYNIRYCWFSFDYNIDKSEIEKVCNDNKIKIVE